MGKETFYFSHDYNTRSDPKIIKLLYKHGMEGYGIYWSIVECLYINDNSINADFELIAFDLRVPQDIIESIINNFGLFDVIDGKLSSFSVGRRLKKREEKSGKARDAAIERWGTSETRLKAKDCLLYLIRVFDDKESFLKIGVTSESVSRRFSGKLPYEYELVDQCEMKTFVACELESEIHAKFKRYSPIKDFAGKLECLDISEFDRIINFAMQKGIFRNAIKESKLKENKIKDIKLKEIKEDNNAVAISFGNYHKKYPGTKRSLETELNNFLKKTKDSGAVAEILVSRLEDQIENRERKKRKGEFVPEWKNMSTYINNRCWEEGVTIEIKKVDENGWEI